MISNLISRLCILICGTLYPGYISFKAVRARNIDDYIKWMMYWIVFAAFTTIEALSDIFLSWFPFYHEFKVLFILWILPTTGNGSSLIYKQCIHPLLKRNETRIDDYLSQLREKWQDLVLQYVKETMLSVSRYILDAINKSFPNGVLGLLPKKNLPNTFVQNTQNIIVEEIIDTQMSNHVKSRRKGSTKTRSKESEMVQHTQGRRRRTRQNKQETNYNSNTS